MSKKNISLDCDQIFYSLDDEIDIAKFLNTEPKKQYVVYNYEKTDNKKFFAKSQKYYHNLNNLLPKYKKCLSKNLQTCQYHEFNESFKKFCMENIETVIDDKMTVISKKFVNTKETKMKINGKTRISFVDGHRSIIVLNIMPQNTSFIILFHYKKGVEFAIGLHCSAVMIANKKFVCENHDTFIQDLFLGKKIELENIFELLEFWTTRWFVDHVFNDVKLS